MVVNIQRRGPAGILVGSGALHAHWWVDSKQGGEINPPPAQSSAADVRKLMHRMYPEARCVGVYGSLDKKMSGVPFVPGLDNMTEEPPPR
jgi:hypothetical protein